MEQRVWLARDVEVAEMPYTDLMNKRANEFAFSSLMNVRARTFQIHV